MEHIFSSTKGIELPDEVMELDAVAEDMYAIVIYNDDVNTFDFVIDCLVELCGHTKHQAEQCATFIHYKGKYAVKSGPVEKLVPICTELCRRGLSAKIEE